MNPLYLAAILCGAFGIFCFGASFGVAHSPAPPVVEVNNDLNTRAACIMASTMACKVPNAPLRTAECLNFACGQP